jgi:selenide,water dikinase
MATTQSNNSEKHIVLIGGGHTHVEVIRKFGMQPEPNVRLTVIARDLIAPYSGMLPGLIAGHYTHDEAHIDLRPLARFANANVYHDEAVGLDLDNRRVLCRNRPDVPFDLVSINVGSRPAAANVPGATEYALPVKPVERFLDGWAAIQERAQQSANGFNVVVVGGGAGGVELALTMHHQLKSKGNGATLRVITDTPDILETHNAGVTRRMRRVFDERGIVLDTASRVTEVQSDTVILEDGSNRPYDALAWVTEAGAAQWFGQSGLATDDSGFISIDDTLRSTSHPFVFAVGDAGSMTNYPRAKSGVFAVRQGPYLAENLRRAARGETLQRFSPQTNFLSLISTGDKNAIASRGKWSAEGPRIWKLKDWIDRRFMEKYDDLPEMNGQTMSVTENAEDAMRCGGCGCKIGKDILTEVLHDLDTGEIENGFIGLNEPDDAAVFEWPNDTLVVQSVDYFKTFVDDPYIFGQITANHCLNDLFAMNAKPHSALANVTLPIAGDTYTKHLLHDVLAGAVHVLREHGAVLAGGHTVEGADFAFGLTVTGAATQDTLLRKGGLRPGDSLILTKPLGTGVLFAGDMRGKAEGQWIEQAIATMIQSNQAAATVFANHGATACTDVTGFGLAGHLVEMLEASNAAATINLAALQPLDGSLELLQGGIASTLQPQNQTAERNINDAESYKQDSRFALLFDPQTAGGLLAGVPADRAEACLERLNAEGYEDAAVIAKIAESNTTKNRIQITQ